MYDNFMLIKKNVVSKNFSSSYNRVNSNSNSKLELDDFLASVRINHIE